MEIKIEYVSLDRLQVNTGQIEGLPKNPRFIKNKDFKNLVNSILVFPKMLYLRPITFANDFVVLGGNQRKEAMVEIATLTFEKVQEILENSREFEEKPQDDKEWILNFWRSFFNSEIKQVPAQNASGFSLAEMTEFVVKDNVGFGQDDLAIFASDWDVEKVKLWGVEFPKGWDKKPAKEIVEDDFAIKETINTTISEGDIIEIGGHRLLCGDSTKQDDLERLLNGKTPDACISDPPYGINVVATNTRMQQLGHKQYINDNDNTTAIKSYQLIKDYVDKLVFWGANHYANKLPNVAGWLVWDKQDGKDSLTYSMGELAWTNIITNVQIFTHIWDGFRKDSERNEKRLHPSQKPVALISWVIDKMSICEMFVDLFNGAGTGMVAAQQKGIICYAMEIEPLWCEVTILRMLNLDKSLMIKVNGKDESKKYLDRLKTFGIKKA